MESLQDELRASWRRGFLVLNELFIHVLITLGVIATIEGIEVIVTHGTQGKPLIFFKDNAYLEFPALWLFDLADVCLIVVLALRGGWLIMKAYRENDENGH